MVEKNINMSSDKHHSTSRASSKVHRVQWRLDWSQCILARTWFHTWVRVLLHSPTDERDSLVTD